MWLYYGDSSVSWCFFSLSVSWTLFLCMKICCVLFKEFSVFPIPFAVYCFSFLLLMVVYFFSLSLGHPTPLSVLKTYFTAVGKLEIQESLQVQEKTAVPSLAQWVRESILPFSLQFLFRLSTDWMKPTHTCFTRAPQQIVNLILVDTHSEKWMWKSLSPVFVTPWTVPSLEFSRPEYWSG